MGMAGGVLVRHSSEAECRESSDVLRSSEERLPAPAAGFQHCGSPPSPGAWRVQSATWGERERESAKTRQRLTCCFFGPFEFPTFLFQRERKGEPPCFSAVVCRFCSAPEMF